MGGLPNDVIYILRGKENNLGLITVLKESGVQLVLIPVDASCYIQPVSATNINIDIISIVKSVIIVR